MKRSWLWGICLAVALVPVDFSGGAQARKKSPGTKPARKRAGVDRDKRKRKLPSPSRRRVVRPPQKASSRSLSNLAQGLEFYGRRRYREAGTMFFKVTESDREKPADRQRAEFALAKTLFHLEFYSASLSYLDRIVETGPAHRHHGAALKWLAALGRKLPPSAAIAERIVTYGKTALARPQFRAVKDELQYLLGRYHYAEGRFKEALASFAMVAPGSAFFARSKFMEGICHVRLFSAKPAAAAFKDLLRVAKEAPETSEISKFELLARLSLARVFYSVGQFRLAIKYYDLIPQESDDWLQSLFEASWAHFRGHNYSKALGNVHTLNAPYFEDQFFPESLILKAVIFFRNCHYDSAQSSLKEFNARYPKMGRIMRRVLRRFESPDEFYAYALGIFSGSSDLPAGVERWVASSMRDMVMVASMLYVDELDRQIKNFKMSPRAWRKTAFADSILTDLILQKSLAQNAAGEIAMTRVKRLAAEIHELEKQAIKIEYEILNARAEKISSDLRKEQTLAASQATGGDDMQPDDEHQYWPFDGQYWRDELGYYRVRVRSRCAGR